MENIYVSLAARTGGNIYIGVVGPVRTGKSTLVKRIMEQLVIPNIEDPYRRERARDELPQSGSGRTIMTSEPKFVPEEAVEITTEGGASFSIRLIDCVGYMVPGAVGQVEGELPRMVTTPWFEHEIPMAQAAEKLELHDSTVSRACADKYLKTPHGVFPFKYFFSAGYNSRSGENVSAHAIEERIKSYIANEDTLHPLSDDKISNLLFAEGFDVARRTVAKYRQKLRIGTASQRKHRL